MKRAIVVFVCLFPHFTFAQDTCSVLGQAPVAPRGSILTAIPEAPCGLQWAAPLPRDVITVYDVDWSALSTSAKYSDGWNDLSGILVWVENTANATILGLVQGQGLTIQPNTTSSSLAARTAPLIKIPLGGFDSQLTFEPGRMYKGVRIWAIIEQSTQPKVATDSIEFGYETDSSIAGWEPTHAIRSGLLYVTASGSTTWKGESFYNNTRYYTAVGDSRGLTHNVWMLERTNMITVVAYTGLSQDGAWPALSSLMLRQMILTFQSTTTPFQPVESDRVMTLLFAKYSGNTNGVDTAWIKRLMIQVLPL